MDLKIDTSKLTFTGTMNYIVQAWRHDNGTYLVDNYMPRRNSVWNGEMEKEEAETQIKETIERMKIAITQFEELLEGKRDKVYYWELENEPWKENDYKGKDGVI